MGVRIRRNSISLSNCLICMGGEETETIITIRDTLPYALECNIDYFSSVMTELARHLPSFEEYTFVFTRSVTEIPTKFGDMEKLVVLVMGDEWARVPTYASGTHAIFKAPGQDVKFAFHKGWWRFNAMAVLQFVRQQAKRFPNHHKNPEQNIFAIPYGYYRLPKRDSVISINKRKYDVAFTGSLDHKNRLGGLVKTNKVLSRERMVRTVDRWKADKSFSVDVKLSQYFPKARDQPQFDDYPQTLMDTKICLSPRGTHLETYRLCEGMYYGCIVVAEEQPDHWFAESSPAFILKDWDMLPELLDDILRNPTQMKALQNASLKYWDQVLAPQSVGKYMSTCLSSLRKDTDDHQDEVFRKAA